jgi:ubiquinone/menaquinone biosynthesis C-methylase UbiE
MMRPSAGLPIVATVVWLWSGLASPGAQRAVQTTAPEDLGVLESPDREQWQQPEEIMDALGIADGSRVADLGAGGGWFTVRLGHRVGPGSKGVVYAVDIQPQMLDAIARRVRDHGLSNVRLIRGATDNPGLPQGLDAVLVVDTYPQFQEPITLLRHVAAALAPTGRLGIVDFRKDGAGGPGPPLDERIDPEVIRDHAQQAGLTFVREETFLRYQFLLIFGKPAVSASDPADARSGAGSTRPLRP